MENLPDKAKQTAELFFKENPGLLQYVQTLTTETPIQECFNLLKEDIAFNEALDILEEALDRVLEAGKFKKNVVAVGLALALALGVAAPSQASEAVWSPLNYTAYVTSANQITRAEDLVGKTVIGPRSIQWRMEHPNENPLYFLNIDEIASARDMFATIRKNPKDAEAIIILSQENIPGTSQVTPAGRTVWSHAAPTIDQSVRKDAVRQMSQALTKFQASSANTARKGQAETLFWNAAGTIDPYEFVNLEKQFYLLIKGK